MDLGGPRSLDPASLIEQQARANRISTSSPFGEVSYVFDRGGPRNDTRATITLSPQQQAILDVLQTGQIAAGQQGVEQLGDLSGGRQAVERATFDRAMGLLSPVLERRENQLRQRLANRGLPITSAAARGALTRFDTSTNEALQRLALSAVLAGGQEQSRATANALALLGLAQPRTPQIFQPGPVDVLAPYRLDMQGASQRQAFAGDIIGGLLGASAKVGAAGFGG